MSKYKLMTTGKVEGVDEAAVRAAAAQAYRDYRVTKVEDLGDKWQVRLDLKVSGAKRQAAPPDFLKEKDDAGEDTSDDSSDSDSDSDSDSADSDSDSDKSEKSDDAKDEGKDEGEKKDPVKAIEGIMSELKSLLDQLGGHASDLKDKADKVDEIHDLTKGDVAPTDEVPPVPPIDDAAAVGPTPGGMGVPKPPRKPPVPTGNRPGAGAPGVPGVFGSRQTEIVEHPMKDDDGEYSFGDVEAAVKAHPDLQNYSIVEIKPVETDNVYVAKLTRK